ncbi:MAG: DUF2267 domain-containing protein [Nannocystaceae bacterium]
MSARMDAFVDDVCARAGHFDRERIELGTRRTLRALGALLGGVPPGLHDALPEALRAELHAGEGGRPYSPTALYERVASSSGLRVGLALEVVQSVVAELGAHLDEPARDQLRKALPPAWAALVLGPRPPALVPGEGPRAAGTSAGHRLATGRPGSERALADSRPGAGQAHSIAASDLDDDRTLSAGRPGPAPERTLARGGAGSSHPVSDAD